MEITVIIMVLCAAVLHATWNALVKSASDKWMLFTAMTLCGSLFALGLALQVPFPNEEAFIFLVVSTFIHYGYYAFLLLSYGAGDLSKVYPIARGSAPLLVAAGSYFFAGESLSSIAYLAIALSSLGIMALAFENGIPRGDDKKPLIYAGITGLFIGAYTVTDGLGVRAAGHELSYIYWLFALEGIPFALWFLYKWRAYMKFIVTDWKFIVGGAFASNMAYGLVIMALSMGAMASVSALRETSVILAAIIGTVILKESFGPWRIVAASMVGLGVVGLNIWG